MDDTLNWLLLDCTVVAVQDTEDVADEVAMTTLFASIKASWKLYKHFFFCSILFLFTIRDCRCFIARWRWKGFWSCF